MILRSSLLIFILMFSQSAFADFTGKGKIILTMGHIAPDCRTAAHKNNATGAVLHFRIHDLVGENDIASVVLTALASKRDVDIYYLPGVTTGCGTQPAIRTITIYE